MKNIHKLFVLYAVVLALGLGIGLPQKHEQELQAAGSPALDLQQSTLEWALDTDLFLPNEPAPEPIESTLLVCGDAMMHMPQLRDATTADGTYNFDHVYRSVTPVISQADYAVVNLETTLAGPKYSGFPAFSAPDSFAEALKTAGFDLFLTANNHCYDRGFDGLSRTLDVLDGMGIAHVGTYRTAEERALNNGVYVADVGGIEIAFVGYTYGTNGLAIAEGKEFSVSLFNTDYLGALTTPDTAQIEADLAAARALEPDLICVMLHWGVEYQTTQNAYQEQIADLLIANGADIILGGHSHVPQPMEWRTVTCADGTERTAFVLYSLGNLISNQNDRYTDTTAAVQLTLSYDPAADETTVTDVAYQPIWRLRRDKSADEVYALLDAHRELTAYEAGTGTVTKSQAEALYRCIDDCRAIFGEGWTNKIP
ncbi:MAG: CapA family protein [Butyricicoccus sp.]|nr:CapA family protein [Butyricicoccus sp.]MBQ8585703.1 CapA family protein [Butyricicoccus sp.]